MFWWAVTLAVRHVSSGGGRLGDAVDCGFEGLLWSPGGFVAGLRSGSREPERRHSVAGGLAGQSGSGGPFSGHVTGRYSPDGHSGGPSGTGVEAGEASDVCERWRRLGQVGGRRSLVAYTNITGKIIGEKGSVKPGGVHQGVEGKNIEVHPGLGPRRRWGVRGAQRGGQDGSVAEVCQHDGSHAGGGGGTNHRAAQRLEEEAGPGQTPLLRLRRLRSVRTESTESVEVQDMDTDGRGLRVEGASRTRELHPVEGLLQGVHYGHVDAAGMHIGTTARVRALCGEVDKVVPRRLAPGVLGRRDGKVRAIVTPPHQDQPGPEGRQADPIALRREETMGDSVQNDSGRTEVLAGPDSWSGPYVASERLKRKSTHPAGDGRPRSLAWRSRGTTTIDGVRNIWDSFAISLQFDQEASQQRKTRGQEEKMARRKGGTPSTPRRATRRFLRSRPRREGRRAKGKRREAERIYLFLVEQWELTMRGTSTGCGVYEFDQAGASMLFVRFAGSSSHQMSNEKVKTSGDKEPGGDEGKKEERKEGEDVPGGEEGGEVSEEAKKKLEEKLKAYIRRRKFRFVHHFAGPRDPLGAEIHRVAKKRNLNVEVIAVEKDWGDDLCADEPYNTHLRWAREGLIDGFHSGFPCSTFSRLRFRAGPNLPEPVRTRAEPYGRSSNNEQQRRECDRGTVMMARSVQMAEEVMKSQTSLIVPKVTSLENPPPSELEEHVSAWGMAEVIGYLRLPGIKISLFNTCAYQSDRARGDRHWKMQQFAGSLFGIESLNRECKCGNSRRRPIVGKKESQESGEYPWELCNSYAVLLMDHFEKMATAEYLEGRLKEEEQDHDGIATSDAAATQMREKRRKEGVRYSPTPENEKAEKSQQRNEGEWKRRRMDEDGHGSSRRDEGRKAEGTAERRRSRERRSTDRKPRRKEEEVKGERARQRRRSESRKRSRSRRGMKEDRGKEDRRAKDSTAEHRDRKDKADLKWRPGEGKYGLLKEEKKKEQQLGQQGFVGGMKNPTEVVEGLPTLQNLGRRILGAWERFCNQFPAAVKVGETYGSKECQWDERLVTKWLKKITGAKGESTLKLASRWSFRSPLQGNLFEAWGRRGNDPETEVPKWIKEGVPLGINKKIGTCGIFPPTIKEDLPAMQGDLQVTQGLKEDIANYVSVVEQEEDAREEIGRLAKLGYVIKVPKKEVEKANFKGTTVSKLGLIVKKKEDGSTKRRIIIDLKRSGGNDKAYLPERLILPRPVDAIAMLRRTHASHSQVSDPQAKVMELVMIGTLTCTWRWRRRRRGIAWRRHWTTNIGYCSWHCSSATRQRP